MTKHNKTFWRNHYPEQPTISAWDGWYDSAEQAAEGCDPHLGSSLQVAFSGEWPQNDPPAAAPVIEITEIWLIEDTKMHKFLDIVLTSPEEARLCMPAEQVPGRYYIVKFIPAKEEKEGI